jgi:hypothetical protein
MIGDAIVPVYCDTCDAKIEIEPAYVFHDYSGKSGYYDTADSAIEKDLIQHGWVVKDGKQYCDSSCVPEDK